MELTLDQRNAVAALRGHRVARLTGLAGTGKSWLSLRLPELLGWHGRVVYAAPTHRARLVLTRKAADAGVRVGTATLDGLTRYGANEQHCDLCRQERPKNGGRCHILTPGPGNTEDCLCAHLDFVTTEKRDISESCEHVIVDEASMCNPRHFADLMEQAPGLSNVLFVGDPGQLPPIPERTPGSPVVPPRWSALTHEPLPTAHLTAIQRQGADSPIIRAAHKVRELPDDAFGNMLMRPFREEARTTPAGVLYAAESTSADAVDRWLFGDGTPELGKAVILTATNTLRWERNRHARRFLHGDDAAPVVVGEIIRARYLNAKKGLTKDTLCQVTRIVRQEVRRTVVDLVTETGRTLHDEELLHADLDAKSPSTLVEGRPPRWLYSYAMSVHASQGSEFDRVAYHVSAAPPPYGDSREHAYTAATRARRDLVVVAPGGRR